MPTLTAIPMIAFNTRALASLVTVAGDSLSRRLNIILMALAQVFQKNDDDNGLSSAVDEALHASLSSVSDDEGLHTVMMLLIDWSVKKVLPNTMDADYVAQGKV